ncbi:PQQ-dependent sugar dehydrogenase [Rhodococcus artemisiae]|uniref:PQQ-dependent sugar dehydrogenase n=1 Tax=Rhodococcus artemisiae TaxID=714159 RepID=A0ABU7L646_9NOCA|nr:PQQ-dependent sugar dehydrogenase [Rhodococcus artemisiae]MEE2056998.1 PQQ-dependent sugar dehydrogenase [Rhodococcus artemisiae]
MTPVLLRRVALSALAVPLVACSSPEEAPATPTPSTPAPADPSPRVTDTVASGLETPWGIAFLPDGAALVTERNTGRVLEIGTGQQVREVDRIAEVVAQGESGLLGIAVSPTFDTDRFVFLYVTTSSDNRILRATYDGEALTDHQVILEGIPAARVHDGGRLQFGPDGMLYAATGEAGDRPLAQDPASLGGKILRVTMDGEPAPDNPDPNSPVYSLGHRNVQGLAFDDDGRLWASEFGQNDVDELNEIVAGGNYGWPEVEGSSDRDNGGEYIDPVVTWPVSQASPSGIAYDDGNLWMASLRGERLWRIGIADAGIDDFSTTEFFTGEYGRLRTVVAAPDGSLWLTTSNRDGRGEPADDDDRILRIENPSIENP